MRQPEGYGWEGRGCQRAIEGHWCVGCCMALCVIRCVADAQQLLDNGPEWTGCTACTLQKEGEVASMQLAVCMIFHYRTAAAVRHIAQVCRCVPVRYGTILWCERLQAFDSEEWVVAAVVCAARANNRFAYEQASI